MEIKMHEWQWQWQFSNEGVRKLVEGAKVLGRAEGEHDRDRLIAALERASSRADRQAETIELQSQIINDLRRQRIEQDQKIQDLNRRLVKAQLAGFDMEHA